MIPAVPLYEIPGFPPFSHSWPDASTGDIGKAQSASPRAWTTFASSGSTEIVSLLHSNRRSERVLASAFVNERPATQSETATTDDFDLSLSLLFSGSAKPPLLFHDFIRHIEIDIDWPAFGSFFITDLRRAPPLHKHPSLLRPQQLRPARSRRGWLWLLFGTVLRGPGWIGRWSGRDPPRSRDTNNMSGQIGMAVAPSQSLAIP